MKYRKAILKELYKLYEEKGPDKYVLADTLKSFKPGDERYLSTVNQLLREDLILCVEALDKHVATGLNPKKLKIVEKELRLWYQDPKFWISIIIALGALIWAILEFMLK